MASRTTLADALHQAGRRAEAETRFREAEQMQEEDQPDYPLLYSLRGFRYCDLLLAAPERAAWQQMQRSEVGGQRSELVGACRAVAQRAAQTLKWVRRRPGTSLLDFALDHLTLGRAALYEAILTQSAIGNWQSEIDQAVAGLRRAGTQDDFPTASSPAPGCGVSPARAPVPTSAQADLDEAWDIAERGPMRLFLADIHLYRARLFFREEHYPWQSPQEDLAAAARLIEQCGYGRRKEELADAEAAIGRARSQPR